MMKSVALPAALSALLLNACSSLKEPELPVPFNGNYLPITEYLSKTINQEMKKAGITGLSIALVDGQNIVWSEGFGFADKANGRTSTSKTVYRAGSISKVFNAAAVMQLHEVGKLDIDRPLVDYVPDFSINSRFGTTDQINLRSLLSHHSGIPGDLVDGMWSEQQTSFEQLPSQLASHYAAYPVNHVFSYSNLGISLSGLAVQNVSGLGYGKYMTKRILEPLGMLDSDFSGRLQGEHASMGYKDGEPINELPLRDIPAGGLNTTVVDLARFLKAVHADGQVNGKTIISKESLAEMLRPQNDNVALDLDLRIGLGWFYQGELLDGQYDIAWHDGGTLAHTSKLLTVPELGLGVVLLSNTRTQSDALSKIANTALRWLYSTRVNRLAELTAGPQPGRLSASEDLDGDYAGPLGLVRVKKNGQHYRADALSTKFKLVKDDDGWYTPSVLWLGFIPLRPEPIKEIKVAPENLENHSVMVGSYKGNRFILGEKISPYQASDAWDRRVGFYRVLNPPHQDVLAIKSVEIKRYSGFYSLLMEPAEGETSVFPLQTANDNDMILLGLGRGLGETIRFESSGGCERARYSGLLLERIEGCETN